MGRRKRRWLAPYIHASMLSLTHLDDVSYISELALVVLGDDGLQVVLAHVVIE